MSETVIVVPTTGNDSNGNPTPRGVPTVLIPLEIAPGNAVIKWGVGGDLTNVEFTVFLPLSAESKIKNGDEITVRGRRCVAMVEVWRSQVGGDLGGLAVLASSKSGKAS